MHGVGEASAAITIVNALATGVGSAVGVELRARAELDLRPSGSRGRWDVEMSDAARTPLVVAALDLALNRLAPGSSGTGRLSLHSEIPAGRGLKSSSAVSSAVVLAVAHATEVPVLPTEVARMSAEVSRATGVSATGAFDDALAGLSVGVVVTDNPRGELLRTFPLAPDLGVALLIPRTTHRPSPEWAPAFQARSVEGRVASEAALHGDWARAMGANSDLVESVVGYDYATLRQQLVRAGALAAGVSGMGPALAAIAPSSRLVAVKEALPSRLGERLTVSPTGGPSVPAGAVR